MEEYRTAYVYVNDIFAGLLKETDYGYSFCYDERYLNGDSPAPVSLTLPVAKEEYKSNILFPFFDGLIPEGWLLNEVSKNWKINKNDRFGIMLVSCKDPIGRVSISEVMV